MTQCTHLVRLFRFYLSVRLSSSETPGISLFPRNSRFLSEWGWIMTTISLCMGHKASANYHVTFIKVLWRALLRHRDRLWFLLSILYRPLYANAGFTSACCRIWNFLNRDYRRRAQRPLLHKLSPTTAINTPINRALSLFRYRMPADEKLTEYR